MGFLSGILKGATKLLGGAGGFLAGPWGGVISTVGGSLLQGAIDGKAARNARNVQMYDNEHQFEKLRDAAIRGGFNPLTALGAVGTGGFGSMSTGTAPLASSSILSGAISGVSDILTGQAERDRAQQSASTELLRVQADQLRAGSAGRIAAATRGARSVGKPVAGVGTIPAYFDQDMDTAQTGRMDMRPMSAPSFNDKGDIPVFTPTGQPISLNKRWADRLKLKPYDAMIVEDYEAYFGDEGGQVVAAPQVPAAYLNSGLSGASVETREDRVERPFGAYLSPRHQPWKAPSYQSGSDRR